MISRTLLGIALLFCANHVANAYILLSANIEDIKKVASKFLSSDIVEQLTSLFSKFKSDNKINLSEENKNNEKAINKISDDEIEESAPEQPKPTKNKPKDKTKQKAPRSKIAESIHQISQEKQKRPPRYKIAESANQLSKDESVPPRYKHTPASLREKDTKDNKHNKKDREGDLYWNDDDDEQRIERVVATSGRLKLPREIIGKRQKYNWDISSDD